MELLFEQGINGRNGEIYNWGMATTDLKTFGERVAQLLRQRKASDSPIASQKELAAAMRIKPQYLSALMSGKRTPNVQHLRAAATALETSVSYLALATDDPSPDVATDAAFDMTGYLSPEADEAAQMVDSMSDELREIALDLLRVLMLHDVDDADPTHATGGASGRLILGKLLKNVKKSADLPRAPLRSSSE